MFDRDQAIGIGVRERPEQHAVRHRTDSGNRRDPESLGDYRRRNESRNPTKTPQPKPHVARDRIHPLESALLAQPLSVSRHVPKAAPRGLRWTALVELILR
jgi:hypothetical protein